jgi:hypothetical protein
VLPGRILPGPVVKLCGVRLHGKCLHGCPVSQRDAKTIEIPKLQYGIRYVVGQAMTNGDTLTEPQCTKKNGDRHTHTHTHSRVRKRARACSPC